MLGSKGHLDVFWSNPLVGSITTLALALLFWPVVSAAWRKLRPPMPARLQPEQPPT
jgi:putative tricarboxylic transport membrane protein